jgi:hypothetical protein
VLFRRDGRAALATFRKTDKDKVTATIARTLNFFTCFCICSKSCLVMKVL